jgi:hypothetical protein
MMGYSIGIFLMILISVWLFNKKVAFVIVRNCGSFFSASLFFCLFCSAAFLSARRTDFFHFIVPLCFLSKNVRDRCSCSLFSTDIEFAYLWFSQLRSIKSHFSTRPQPFNLLLPSFFFLPLTSP